MKSSFKPGKLLFLPYFLLILLTIQHCTTTTPAAPPPFQSVADCYADPSYGIPATEFMQGVARYRQVHQGVVNANNSAVYGLNFEDARSFWYSLDTLKKFICLIERYSDSLHIPEDSLGVRIYYAVYPNQAGGPTTGYACHHTLFFVPTRSNPGTGQAYDFDPRQNGKVYGSILDTQQVKANPAYYASLRLLILGKSMVTMVTSPGTSANPAVVPLSSNEGQLCPPNCPNPSTLSLVDALYPTITY